MTHTQTQGADGAGTFDHEFKSHPDVFWPAARGEKTFEYRRDDRGGYEVGQTVRLRCYDPDRLYHPVPPLDRRITNILRGGEFELPQGYCILSLAPLADGAGTKTVLWSAWPEDDCDSDPRIDPMAQKVTEWFVGRWPLGADEPECRILIGEGRLAEIVARRIAEKLTSVLNTDAILALKAAPSPAEGAGTKAAFTAQGEGTVAAPLEPTDGMQQDGLAALETAIRTHGKPSLPGFAAAHVYRAMLAARPATPSTNPAPAATPGVPDSLRALMDAARPFYACFFNDNGDISISTGNLTIDHWLALDRAFTAANATQPAGQAGDAGAKILVATLGEFQRRNGYHKREIEELLTEFGELLLSKVAPAPNSTRTGAAETSAEDDITQAMIQAGRYAANLNDGTLASIYLAMLAARPEAPSDAGWSFDMEAAPQDGTRILLWMHGCWIHPVIGYRAPSVPGSQRDCWREHGSRARIHRADCWRLIPAGPTPPSDPAPSGQAEG